MVHRTVTTPLEGTITNEKWGDCMNQQPSSIPAGVATSRPTEVRLKPSSPMAPGRPAAFDPTQIAGGAAYAILLYLGVLYGLTLVAQTAGLSIRVRSTIALVASLILTALVFGTMAVLRDRLSRKSTGMAPEKVMRLDDTLRWMVPPDIMSAYLGPMTLLRLNLLDLVTAADNLQQRVTSSAYVSWPSPLDRLATVLFTVYYGIEGSDVPSFAAQDIEELRRYLAERHPSAD
ncbi:MAG: hypothetical protein ACYDHF_08255 [Candidatus Cryosericum sp.]